MTTELATIEIKNPLQVFSTPKGLDAVIDKVEAEVNAIDKDVSTEAGRENIRSLAFKLAKSKNALDKMGKDLTEEQRAIVTAVNAERSRAWDRMEALQHKVRQPLTDYENTEKLRVQGHEDALAHIVSLGVFEGDVTTAIIESRIKQFEVLAPRNWQEFDIRYAHEVKTLSAALESRLAASKKADADREELARLQAAEQARLQKEREDKIAADAKAEAERVAKAEADALAAKVKADADAAAKREQDALDAVKKAEADKVAAAAKAEADKKDAEEAAAKAERDKIAAEQEAEKKAADAREKDKEHKAKINNEAKAAIIKVGAIIDAEECAQAIIVAIAKGLIPHVKITY